MAKTEFEKIKNDDPEIFENARFLNTGEACQLEISSMAFPEAGTRAFTRRVTYPPELRRKGIQGVVKAEFIVYENGRTGEVKTLFSRSPELSRIVREAILSTKYVPAYCNKKPAASIAYIEISFRTGF